jgi:hypothetical protein
MPLTHELRLTLSLLPQPDAWRLVRVPADLPLPKLHLVFQAAFGWQNCHLHHFLRYDAKGENVTAYIAPPDPQGDDWAAPDDPARLDSRKLTLADELRAPGDLLGYEYDFGDSWEHCAELVCIHKSTTRLACPVLLDGALAAPPEDCGGPGGYEDFCAALADPKHPDHDHYADWIGKRTWNPDNFDFTKTARSLAKLKT